MNRTHVVEGYVKECKVNRNPINTEPPTFESVVLLPGTTEWNSERITINGEYPILTKVKITIEILPETLRRQLGVSEAPQIPEKIS